MSFKTLKRPKKKSQLAVDICIDISNLIDHIENGGNATEALAALRYIKKSSKILAVKLNKRIKR
jgi:hypothetical protein